MNTSLPPIRLFAVGAALLTLLAAGSTTLTAPRANAATPASPDAHERAAAPGFPPGVLGPLLIAEFEARRGGAEGLRSATQAYIDTARATRDPDLAERATRLATRHNLHALAVDASALWRDLAGERSAAWQYHALALVRSGDLDGAAEALRHVARHPDESDGDSYDQIIAVVNQEQDPERRVRLMEAIADDSPESRFAFARVLARSGQFERGVEMLAILQREAPDEDRYVIAHALLLHGQGKSASALELIAERKQRGPPLGAALLETHAQLLDLAGRREEAAEEYARVLEHEPDDRRTRQALGRLLLEMERFREAREHFDRLRSWPETRDSAWYHLGWIDETLEEPEQAIEAYRRVRHEPYYLNARVRIAILLADLGRLAQARRHLASTWRRAEDEDVHLYLVEARLLSEAELYREAMGVFRDALDAYPGQTDLLYSRAMLAVQHDRLDVAEQDLRSIIAREPNHADALNALGYSLTDRTDRHGEAYELIRRALALEPNKYQIIDSMGWVLYRMGRLTEALEYLRRSYKMEPHPEVAAHLGEVLWMLGNHDEARDIWERALETDPDDKVLQETLHRFGI